MTTIKQFYEKILESFKMANNNIINRISGVITGEGLCITIRSKKEGRLGCINAYTFTIKPDEKHKMRIDEVWVGYDEEGSPWSDHMGGHIIDCNGKNVADAVEAIVSQLNKLVDVDG